MKKFIINFIFIITIFLSSFASYAEWHYISNDWYDSFKEVLPREEVVGIVISNEAPPDNYIAHKDLNGKGLNVYVLDTKEVIINFPEDDELWLSNFANEAFSFYKYESHDDFEIDENGDYRFDVRPIDEMDNQDYDNPFKSSLVYIDNFDLLHTSTTGYMELLFYGDSHLENINLSQFTTRNAESLYGLFGECRSLKNINCSNFDTRLAKNMTFMFANCHELEDVDISSFEPENLSDISYMFFNCPNIKRFTIGSSMIKYLKDFGLKGIWKNEDSGKIFDFSHINDDTIKLITAGAYVKIPNPSYGDYVHPYVGPYGPLPLL